MVYFKTKYSLDLDYRHVFRDGEIIAVMGRAKHGILARLANASFQALSFGSLTCFVACAGFTFAVRNDRDGQAGMGAAFGAFYLSIIVGLITFIASMVRSRRGQKS